MNVDLSIIIPVYNTALYLKDCLDSVINSDFGEYEIIIIDDGSTDDSFQIIHGYMQKYSEIQYIYQENSGQGVARNVGLQKAVGKYIYFMDSDDILDAQKFSKVLNEIKRDDLDAIFFDGESFLDENYHNEDDLLLFNYKRHKSYGKFETGEEIFTKFSANGEMFVSPCLYIVKREIIIQNNLFFPTNMKLEDEVFTTILFFYMDRCGHTNEVVFFRRLRPNSTMTTQNYSKSFQYSVKVLYYLDEFYSKHTFQSTMSEDFLFRKMRNMYIKCLSLMHKSQLNDVMNDKEIMSNIAKKHKHFDKFGQLATFNISLYKWVSEFYLGFRKKFRGIKHNR